MFENDLVTLLLLAAIAGFLLFRLRSVLGERSGFENPEKYRPGASGSADTPSEEPDNVVALRRNDGSDDDSDIFAYAELNSELGQALKQIKLREPGFNMQSFMEGAKGAYEMLLMAFETGDKQTLKQFLDREVYDAFAQAIDERRAQNLNVDVRFVGIKTAEPVEAQSSADERSGDITVRFVAEIIMAVRNAQGELVEGDPSNIQRISDVWTFGRQLGSSDPNWMLTATGDE
ncbi:MAG: Tim44/TimA family putative adaptor protein [Neomegalonema sp.]